MSWWCCRNAARWRLPVELRAKTRVIFQLTPLRRALPKTARHLRALMVGHLRAEKSPETLCAAARQLANSSAILIDHIGDALDPALGETARATMAECANYRWLGGLAHEATRRRIQRAHLLVHASRIEGGAHVVMEAVCSGTPVVASRIDGNVGMLGEDYAGYFEWGDAHGLAELIAQCRASQARPRRPAGPPRSPVPAPRPAVRAAGRNGGSAKTGRRPDQPWHRTQPSRCMQPSSPSCATSCSSAADTATSCVLKRFGMQPLPGVRLTVICTDTHTPYSGMLPGYIAGHYSYDDVHIDLRRLAEFAGARFYLDEVVGLDRQDRKVLCRHRPPVSYDRLSINIGSTPDMTRVNGAADHAIPVKPIRRFNDRWLALLERVCRHAGLTTIALVGAGAGGVELTLAMQYRLRNELQKLGRDPDELRFHLFSAEPDILPTHNARVRRSFERVLAQRGVHGASGRRGERGVARQGGYARRRSGRCRRDRLGHPGGRRGLAARYRPGAGRERLHRGARHPADRHRPSGLRGRRLRRDGRHAAGEGRRVRRAPGQAAGREPATDGAGAALAQLPAATPLAGPDQHRRSICRRLARRVPCARRLGVALEGLDRSAVHGQVLPICRQWRPALQVRDSAVPLDQAESAQAISAVAMRCGGCGAKVGATVLSRALAAVRPIERDDVLIGLHAPDDAAIVRVPPGKAMVHTVDFFRAFIDDPWLFGKIAANHALGDIFAMGAEAQSATAIATVPPGLESKVEDTLLQMMSGAVEVLNEAGCALVGGHTGEGRELALGFAVNGLIDETLDGVMRKGGMRAGEVLILTKPIGTGTLLAAHARLRARGRWIDDALSSMLQSNRLGARCLIEHGASACTDLTGFGLLGHLVEMTRPSGVDVELDLAALPVLDGAAETSAAGILSSLQAANLRLRRALRNQEQGMAHPNYPLLFDPQTAGGLLASLPAERAEACIGALRALGYQRVSRIGRVLAAGGQLEPILLKV